MAYCKKKLEVIRGIDTPAVYTTDALGLIRHVSHDICSTNFEPSMNPCNYGSVSQSLEYVRRKLEEIRGGDEIAKGKSVAKTHKQPLPTEFCIEEVKTLSDFVGSMDSSRQSVQIHSNTPASCVIGPDLIKEYARGKVWEQIGTDISSQMEASSVLCEKQLKASDVIEETDACVVLKPPTTRESCSYDAKEEYEENATMVDVKSVTRTRLDEAFAVVQSSMELTVYQKWGDDLNLWLTMPITTEKVIWGSSMKEHDNEKDQQPENAAFFRPRKKKPPDKSRSNWFFFFFFFFF
ncbi:hypothetical protein RND81_09G025100 [Saponaria officinalis]|uniref:Uncharacterized protein n=1 Tax=Saponaria officinalis TaxID=3572 RepID=A0AAW1IH56_SAPOF